MCEIVQTAEESRKELLRGELTRSLKPSFVFTGKTEKVEGLEVQLVSVKLPKKDAEYAPKLKALLGPDWNKVRLAVVGKQVAVLVGSDLGLLKQTVANLEAGKKGLADEKLTSGRLARVAAGRTIEFHFKPENRFHDYTLMHYIYNYPLKTDNVSEETPQRLTSLALTIKSDAVQVEIVPDKSVVKSFAAFFGLTDDSSGAEMPKKPE